MRTPGPLHELSDGIARFQREVFPAKAELFARLAGAHRPTALFIGCSDARVVPELITQSEPGELFVVRTAGNLVPARASDPDGVTASIEYAVSVLGVTAIVVCGHSGCGAMTALAEGADLSSAGSVARWLRHADASVARTAETGPGRLPALIRENVRVQLENLATHPAVARALAAATLGLHGWVYDIPSGGVSDVGRAGGL
ncbi:carbonic anhydrase [Streptomyces yangpuensis]|uniref:carbonic anhydrase n=1 Tax=Streptomyces yangpuensis TaxID=1648182 RepID=UPI00364E6256